MFSWLLLFFIFPSDSAVHVPVRRKITNPLIPQQAGVIPMPTGSHYHGLVLCCIERAASAAKPLYIYQLL